VSSHNRSKFAEGFYLRRHSSSDSRSAVPRHIVHYRGSDGNFTCGAQIPEQHLGGEGLGLAALTTESETADGAALTLHAACCYPVIERQIVLMLSRKLISPWRRRPRPRTEIELSSLIEMIRVDLQYSARAGKVPSVRLADLLAAAAIRSRRPDYLEQLRQLLENSVYAELFRTRIAKWTDVKSPWYTRWSEPRNRLKWGGETGVVF
jgi:hypothetical protein